MVYVKRKTRQTLHLPAPKIKTKVRIPLESGDCYFYSFEGLCSYKEHIALAFKKAVFEDKPMIGIHCGCLRNAIESEHFACSDKLWQTIHYFSENSGILLYLGQTGCDKEDYNELRSYKVAAQMLKTMGIKSIHLFSYDPEQVRQLQEWGIEVAMPSS